MNKPAAWFPLYVDAWDADTRALDVAEDGAYGRLIRSYWRNGPPADDDAKLARIVGVTLPRWRKLRPAVAPFFTIGDGVWRNKRADLEREKAAERYAKAVERASAGGRAKAAKSGASSTLEAGRKHSTSRAIIHSVARGSDEPLAIRGRRSPTSEPEGSSPPAWQGPQDLRDLCVSKQGEDFTRSWLDVCGWQDVPEPMILAPGQLYADRLWRALRRELADRGISIGRKAA